MTLRTIFVTGGVLSSLGKGISAASLGALLEARGYKVRLRKFEPYLNVDPGTMSPFQHGEVYVTEDGGETDLDLGHYERFTSLHTRKSDAVSTGQIYSKVIAKERRGDYLGATIQVIPHITNEIKDHIVGDIEDDVDFLICEIGGTVGDIEGLPFLEAIRQYANEAGRRNVLFMHLTLLPYIKTAKELKTKPSQHSVKELQSMGIQPDILLCRSEVPIPQDARDKLSQFCNIKSSCVIEALDVDTIYQVPLLYAEQGLDREVCSYFGLEFPKSATAPDLSEWQTFVDRKRAPKGKVTVAVIGKYTGLQDAYKSIAESFDHASIVNELDVDVKWLDAETITEETDLAVFLKDVSGILVPGGYGERGINGKLRCIQYARENGLPFFGICLGMQLAVIEFARNVLGLKTASSTEMSSETDHPIVKAISKWEREGNVEIRTANDDLGGTMRLGAYPCDLTPGSLAHTVYGQSHISERHRHRFEMNKAYEAQLASHGMLITGWSPDKTLPEIVEVKDHPWYLAMQFHPEFKSRPGNAHPVFAAFVKAAYEQQQNIETQKEKVA